MLSVVVATHNSESRLVPTLAALVPGATAALVSDVIVADGGSEDATAEVADYAGCNVLTSRASLGARFAEAAAQARSLWLLFLTAGVVPQPGWIDEIAQFMEDTTRHGRTDSMAAAFRQMTSAFAADSSLRQAAALLGEALGLRRAATQGLLLHRQHYQRIGGHPAERSDPEADILRRLGRRRLTILRSGAIVV